MSLYPSRIWARVFSWFLVSLFVLVVHFAPELHSLIRRIFQSRSLALIHQPSPKTTSRFHGFVKALVQNHSLGLYFHARYSLYSPLVNFSTHILARAFRQTESITLSRMQKLHSRGLTGHYKLAIALYAPKSRVVQNLLY
jgi:hypothetical protein